MGSATYFGHSRLALEATPNPVINTLGFPPRLFHTMVTIGLVAPAKDSEWREISEGEGRT